MSDMLTLYVIHDIAMCVAVLSLVGLIGFQRLLAILFLLSSAIILASREGMQEWQQRKLDFAFWLHCRKLRGL